MQDLKLTLIQTDLFWENPQANLAMLEEKIWQIGQNTDIILLPEMFTTGFTMNASSVAEPMNLTAYKWMKQQAAQTGAVVAGSVVIKEKGKFFNRLIWMQPDGEYYTYDKRHLFRMAGEDEVYAVGTRRVIVNWKGWNICPLICYDLRFPVWSRNKNDYDLLIYIANWPAARKIAWETLLPARAIENLSFCVGVNRTGTDGKNLDYAGGSGVWNYKGEKISDLGDSQSIGTVSLNKTGLIEFRNKFPAHLDADDFLIKSPE